MLKDYTTIRTGAVLSRKEAKGEASAYQYSALTLKALSADGTIAHDATEAYFAGTELKRDYFTGCGDVLLRLTAPYTATVITKEDKGLLVSSHFAIIRASNNVNPWYLCWWLMQNRKKFYLAASGSVLLGTISSGLIGSLPFEPPSRKKQDIIAEVIRLAARERQLLKLKSEKQELLINAQLKKLLNSLNLEDAQNDNP